MGHFADASRHSPLTSQIDVLTRDLAWTLANFTFVANATTLVSECDIAHSPAMSVASCRTMPQPALAFIGDSPDLLATYSTFLTDPGHTVDLLVNDAQRSVVERAFHVDAVVPKWQLVFRGEVEALQAGRAAELVENDWPVMEALAKGEHFPLRGYGDDVFRHGPAFGIWDKRKLVAMGMTTVEIPGAAQIDNVVTRREYRRQGLATDVTAALVVANALRGMRAFAVVSQDNEPAIALFRKLRFDCERPMYAMHCLIRDPDHLKDALGV